MLASTSLDIKNGDDATAQVLGVGIFICYRRDSFGITHLIDKALVRNLSTRMRQRFRES